MPSFSSVTEQETVAVAISIVVEVTDVTKLNSGPLAAPPPQERDQTSSPAAISSFNGG
ncbi:MAG: hypothetical protein ACRC46_03410 [Thermoguttaceae bacterium]